MAIGCVLTNPTTTTTSTTTTLDLLAQLVNHTSLYHKLRTAVIVVILSDADRSMAEETVERIVRKFLYEISIGFISILQQATYVYSVMQFRVLWDSFEGLTRG